VAKKLRSANSGVEIGSFNGIQELTSRVVVHLRGGSLSMTTHDQCLGVDDIVKSCLVFNLQI